MITNRKIGSAIIVGLILVASMVFPLTANATTFACTEAGKTIIARTTAKVPRKGTAYFGYRYWDTAA